MSHNELTQFFEQRKKLANDGINSSECRKSILESIKEEAEAEKTQ